MYLFSSSGFQIIRKPSIIENNYKTKGIVAKFFMLFCMIPNDADNLKGFVDVLAEDPKKYRLPTYLVVLTH